MSFLDFTGLDFSKKYLYLYYKYQNKLNKKKYYMKAEIRSLVRRTIGKNIEDLDKNWYNVGGHLYRNYRFPNWKFHVETENGIIKNIYTSYTIR